MKLLRLRGRTFLEMMSSYTLQLGLIGMLVVIWVIFISTSPETFFKPGVYRTLMRTIPFTLILGLGLTYIISLGEIDLSFPSVMGFSAWVFTTMWVSTGSAALGVIVAVCVGCALELINGMLITKTRVPSIVVTLAAMFLWRGAVMIASQGASTSLYWAKNTVLHDILVKNWFIPLQMVWAVVASVVFWLVLFRHRLGSHLLAIGDNETAAKALGVNVDRVKIAAFGLMGIMSAIGGIMINLVVLGFFPSMGEGYLLPVMAAVFIGGTSIAGGEGTILGTVIGAIIIGSLDTGVVSMGFSGFWIDTIYGAIIVIVTVLQASILRR